MKRIGTCEAEGLASPVSCYTVSGGRAALSLSVDRPIDSLKATMPMDVTGICRAAFEEERVCEVEAGYSSRSACV